MGLLVRVGFPRFQLLMDCCRVKPVLETPDQKTRVFLIQIELTPHALVHTQKVFGEMLVRF
jgi:hypothetical protein